MCRATRGYNNRPRPKRRGRNQFHAARRPRATGRKEGAAGRLHKTLSSVHSGRTRNTCMRRNEYRRIFPGTSSRQRRSALDVHGGWSLAGGGWPPMACGGVVLLSVVTVVRQALLPFFPFFLPPHHGPFPPQRQTRKDPPSWSRELGGTPRRAIARRLPSMRIVSTGIVGRHSSRARGPVAPRSPSAWHLNKPLALALTGAHGKKGKKRGTCRADLASIAHGPTVLPNNSRTWAGFHPGIVSTFSLLVKEERGCLASTRSSIADRKQWPDHHLLVFNPFLLKDLGGLGERDPHDTHLASLPVPIVDFTRQTLTRIAQISVGPPPPPPPPAPPLHPMCHRTPHTTSCYRRWLARGSDRGWVFLAFSSPSLRRQRTRRRQREGFKVHVPFLAAWDAGAGLAITTHGRRVWGSKRGRRGASRGSPAIVPWSTDGTEKKRHQSNRSTTKRRNLGWGWLSRLPSVPVRLPEFAVTGSWPSCHFTLHDLQNGDGPAQPFGPAHHMARWRPTGPSP